MNKENEDWDLVILPKNGLFDLKLKEVWRYRDLLWILVRRDFISFYKQTILGPIWFLIQPLATAVIYVFIFGKIAKISTDDVPLPLFYLSGITAWTYFSDCLLKTSSVFRDNSAIFGKVYFPRLIMPLSIVISNLVRFGVQLLLLLGVLAYYLLTGMKIQVTTWLLFFPLLVVMMAALGLGLGLMVSALTTKYRDFVLLVSFTISFLMYASPVVYPLSVLPPRIAKIVSYNPLTSIIEAMRMGLFGQGTVDMFHMVYSLIVTVIILIIGCIVYTRVEKNFIDTI